MFLLHHTTSKSSSRSQFHLPSLAFVLFLLSTLSLAGCGSGNMVKTALVDPMQPDDGKVLFGSYANKLPNGEVQYLFLGNADKSFPKNTIKVMMVGSDPESVFNSVSWPVFVYRLKDVFILHIPIDKSFERLDSAEAERKLKLPLDQWDLEGFVLMSVKVVPHGLEFSGMNGPFWASQIQQKTLSGTIKSSDVPKAVTVQVTSSREQLKLFLENNLEKAFESESNLLRRLAIP